MNTGRVPDRIRRLWARILLATGDTQAFVRYLRGCGATIGEGVRLGSRDLGSEPYLVTIGDYTLVSGGVLIATHDGGTWVFRDRLPDVNRFGRVTIGSRCFIGMGSILLPDTIIGDRCLVAAGAVVKGEFPAGQVIGGVPARVICSIEEYERRCVDESLPIDRSAPLRPQLERLLPPHQPTSDAS
jgi:acetyltransferase-like isoleucine patch superfamily enzyme